MIFEVRSLRQLITSTFSTRHSALAIQHSSIHPGFLPSAFCLLPSAFRKPPKIFTISCAFLRPSN
jgi:hypothetical protein